MSVYNFTKRHRFALGRKVEASTGGVTSATRLQRPPVVAYLGLGLSYVLYLSRARARVIVSSFSRPHDFFKLLR